MARVRNDETGTADQATAKRRAAASAPVARARAARYIYRVKRVHAAVLGIGIATASTAYGGAFGGFGGRENAFLVGVDRVCTPLPVRDGAATGAPACHKAASDELAGLSIKPPRAERGARAQFAARAQGRTLTITRPDSGATVVVWESIDPISKVVDVYASTYGNVVGVELMVRRGGRDQADAIAFDVRGAGGDASGTPPTGTPPTPPTGTPPTGTPPPPPPAASPELTKAIARARKTSGKAALTAWAKVVALDAAHSEARYALAVAHAKLKRKADAVAALAALTASTRADAIEYLVAARFDKAFAAWRADPAFRAAVGLDRPATALYERIMGLGGVWEQPATSCDTPEVTLTLARARTFVLRIRSTCSGARYDDRFKGTWDLDASTLVLSLPKPEGGSDPFPCAVEPKSGEDAIHCSLGEDVEFVVQAVRR